MIDKINKAYPGWKKIELYICLLLIPLAVNMIIEEYNNPFAVWGAALQIMLAVTIIAYQLLVYEYCRVTNFLKDIFNELNKEGPESTRGN